MKSCKHPPTRLYSYWACGDDGTPRSVLVVSCLECRTVLTGRALTTDEFNERNSQIRKGNGTMRKYHYEWIEKDEPHDLVQWEKTDASAIAHRHCIMRSAKADVAVHRVEGDERCHMQDVIYIAESQRFRADGVIGELFKTFGADPDTIRRV